MSILLKVISLLGYKQILAIVIALLRVVANKTKNKYDDSIVKELEEIIKYVNEYSEKL